MSGLEPATCLRSRLPDVCVSNLAKRNAGVQRLRVATNGSLPQAPLQLLVYQPVVARVIVILTLKCKTGVAALVVDFQFDQRDQLFLFMRRRVMAPIKPKPHNSMA